MSFIQTIDIKTDDIEPVQNHVNQWHSEQAGVAPGYQGARILADEDQPRRYVIEVEFTSKEDAEANNDRSETAAWGEKLERLIDGSPKFGNHALVCTT